MIKEDIKEGILTASFDNGKFNSINLDVLNQLGEIVKKVNSDDSIKGMILTGEGRTFCSGFDLSMFLGFKDLPEVIKFFEISEQVFMDFFMCDKPIITAMNGAAMAGGLILGMGSDYRICKNHPKIQIGMSEIKIGLGLSIVQTEMMRFGLDGDKKYRDVMYFGERYNVDKALSLGIIDEIVEEDKLLERGAELIKLWMDNPARAFILLKKSLRQPTFDRMKHYLDTTNWGEGLNCLFDPQTRATLEVVVKMMV